MGMVLINVVQMEMVLLIVMIGIVVPFDMMLLIVVPLDMVLLKQFNVLGYGDIEYNTDRFGATECNTNGHVGTMSIGHDKDCGIDGCIYAIVADIQYSKQHYCDIERVSHLTHKSHSLCLPKETDFHFKNI